MRKVAREKTRAKNPEGRASMSKMRSRKLPFARSGLNRQGGLDRAKLVRKGRNGDLSKKAGVQLKKKVQVSIRCNKMAWEGVTGEREGKRRSVGIAFRTGESVQSGKTGEPFLPEWSVVATWSDQSRGVPEKHKEKLFWGVAIIYTSTMCGN